MSGATLQPFSPLRANRLAVRLVVCLLVVVVAVLWRIWLEQRRIPPVTRPTAAEWQAADAVRHYQARLQVYPDDAGAYAMLGLALLQQVRETGDVGGYARAEQAFTAALQRQPQQTDALVGQGLLALARHDFEAALIWGEQARQANPYGAEALGVLVDAYVELGRYGEAIAAAQEMVDLRPGVASYSRVAYIRELHGNVAGAIAAMTMAVEAGVPGVEGTLWSGVQLGHLYFNNNQWAEAEVAYRTALLQRPDYLPALAGLARLEAARGELDAAIEGYRSVVARLPLPEYLVPLGELYEVAGQRQKAEEQFALVHVIQQLNQSVGMDVDMELALFAVEHGDDPAGALVRAQRAYAARPSIYAADVLAWALYHIGRYAEAQQFSAESLRLGTQDALLHFHAGMIAYALGDNRAAKEHLKHALTINPAFSIRHAAQARILVQDVGSCTVNDIKPGIRRLHDAINEC